MEIYTFGLANAMQFVSWNLQLSRLNTFACPYSLIILPPLQLRDIDMPAAERISGPCLVLQFYK